MNSAFPKTEALYRDAVRAVSDPGDYFASDEHRELSREAAAAFSAFEPSLPAFFDVVRGLDDGRSLGIGASMCFPSRFLEKPSTRDLPPSSAELLDDLIQQVFFLGLATHYLLHTFPTRSELPNVHVPSLLQEWARHSLMASTHLRHYSRDANDLPRRIYEWWFDAKAKTNLQRTFHFGFWRLAKTRSFLRNLYFAGASLGMHSDLMTERKKPIDLPELRAQFAGTRFCELVQHHLRRQTQRERIQGVQGTIALLPATERGLAEEFIDRWNVRTNDRDFWQRDTADVFDEVVADARSVLRPFGLETDDEAAFNLFNIIVLNYAYGAYDQPRMREFMGIGGGA